MRNYARIYVQRCSRPKGHLDGAGSDSYRTSLWSNMFLCLLCCAVGRRVSDADSESAGPPQSRTVRGVGEGEVTMRCGQDSYWCWAGEGLFLLPGLSDPGRLRKQNEGRRRMMLQPSRDGQTLKKSTEIKIFESVRTVPLQSFLHFFSSSLLNPTKPFASVMTG